MKAIMQASHMRVLDQEAGKGSAQYCNRRKFRVPVVFCRYVSATSSGRDPTSV